MKLVTAKQMAAVDRRTIEKEGIPGLQLMEQAGHRVFEAILGLLGPLVRKKAVVVCGKGNNGGDGFVVARLLHQEGVHVTVFLLSPKDASKADAKTNLQGALDLGIDVQEVLTDDDLPAMKECLREADVVVDALFGTGIQGEVKGLPRQAIEAINASAKPVVAVDVPSGLNTDTGELCGVCVQATVTVTFGLPKIGHVFYPGRAQCGVVKVADIGIPEQVIDALDCTIHLTMPDDVARLLPQRTPTAHKGKCGRVLVIAGSVGMTGAAALASEAALRSGAGLVTLGLPVSLNDIMEVKLTEVMTKPLPEVRKRRCLSLRAVGDIRRLVADADVLAIGPGLSTHYETKELVRRIVAESRIPMVIDADGVNALSEAPDLLKQKDGDIVITPHVGEFSRLTGQPIPDILAQPREVALQFAQDTDVTLVLKNAPSMVATSNGSLFVNPSGNPGLATAGSGDVLTGILSGMIAQGLKGQEAAKVSVFLHGWAGDLAKARVGEMGFIAGDILQAIPQAIQDILDRKALEWITSGEEFS